MVPARERAQATIEFVGTLPLLALAALCCLQALLLALGVVFAQPAVERAAQGMTRTQVAATLPSGWRSDVRISHPSSQTVRVSVRVPAVIPGAGRWLRVAATAEEASP